MAVQGLFAVPLTVQQDFFSLDKIFGLADIGIYPHMVLSLLEMRYLAKNLLFYCRTQTYFGHINLLISPRGGIFKPDKHLK